MIKARFYTNPDDPRPVFAPLPHPYWITGFSDEHGIVVAYADDLEYIMRNWPDAERIDIFEEGVSEYAFSERFPRPQWLR